MGERKSFCFERRGPFLGVWIADHYICLKGPRFPMLYSERHSPNVQSTPLFWGWRITIRKDTPNG